MTNPMINPQPNYSGVTIQISNPAVNVGNQPQCMCYPQSASGGGYYNIPQASAYAGQYVTNPQANPQIAEQAVSATVQATQPQAYPAAYYLNNYNQPVYNQARSAAQTPQTPQTVQTPQTSQETANAAAEAEGNIDPNSGLGIANRYDAYADNNSQKETDLTTSKNIIGEISEREAKIAEEKKNTKETKIVALTDEYIKSLENYLNNPNDEIRLMASKEILTRLDEDKDRYDDAALNALLNKMMQDPSKLIRVAALAAFASGLASGNDYTVNLLQNIQSNPNADKEDVLQAADILLRMSGGVEVKNIPNPQVKETQDNNQ